MNQDYRPYQEVAERVAVEAGELLLQSYGQVSARQKRSGDLVTDADLASQKLITERLAESFPDHTLLAEEEEVGPDPSKPWRWVVDPLDGTINFAHGFPYWCVSIALEHEDRLVVGVVHDPARRTTYSASQGAGATRNGRPVRVGAADQLRDSLIATALPIDFLEDVDRQVAYFLRFSNKTHSVRRTGSSALNLALLASGAFEVCYATFMHPWDAAAGVVLVREAGGTVTKLSGEPYDLYAKEILATNGQVHAETLRTLAEARRPRT